MQSPSKANGHSASQEFPQPFIEHQVSLQYHNSPSLVPILNQKNPIPGSIPSQYVNFPVHRQKPYLTKTCLKCNSEPTLRYIPLCQT